MRLADWASDIGAFLLPAGCVSCGDWIPRREGPLLLCRRCGSRLRTAPWPRCARCHAPLGSGRVAGESCRECREWPSALRSARYAYVLSSPVDDLVHGLKYEGWSRLAEPMGEALAALALPDHGSARRVVVPVPTSEERERRRGYNQADLLARAFAARCDYPCRELLRRTASGPSQTTLHPSQRRANVAGVFAPAPRAARLARGAQLLLVDDVLTTGATAAEAAETLMRMGAAGVTAVAYARAFPNAPGAEP